MNEKKKLIHTLLLISPQHHKQDVTHLFSIRITFNVLNVQNDDAVSQKLNPLKHCIERANRHLILSVMNG